MTEEESLEASLRGFPEEFADIEEEFNELPEYQKFCSDYVKYQRKKILELYEGIHDEETLERIGAFNEPL
jgi:hypothetical protein